MIGRLLVGPEIGRGGYAIVRQALEPDQQRQLAWKELREEKARQAHLATAHQAEAWILSSTSHPSIPHVYAYVREYHAFVMDFIPGVSLDRLLEGWSEAPMEVRSRMVTELVGAVVEIHRRGFLHLDLKLANLLLTPHGNLYLIDFGVAALHWMNTHAGTRFPLPISPVYAAPEMIASRPVYDQRADVYSLAVVLYTLLAGRRPYRMEPGSLDATRQAIEEIHARGIPLPRRVEPRVPSQVELAVMEGLRFDPAERPATVMAFGKRVVASLREIGMADMAAMEAWSAGKIQDGGAQWNVPRSWDGSHPYLQLSLDEEALGVAEPVLVSRVATVSIEPDRVVPGGEVLVTWRPAVPGEQYELGVLGPGDLRPRTTVTRSCPHRLRLERPGTYHLQVRAINGNLRGGWSPKADVEVARPGLGPGAKAAIGGVGMAALMAGGGIVLLLGRGGEGPRPLPTPAPLVVASLPSPTPEMDRETSSPSAWISSTQHPVVAHTKTPTTTPTSTRTRTFEPAPTMTPTPPPVPPSPLAGRVVGVIGAGAGGLELRAVNGVETSIEGVKLSRSFEKLDGRCLRVGLNTVRLHVRESGQDLELHFALSEDDLYRLRNREKVTKSLPQVQNGRLILRVEESS